MNQDKNKNNTEKMALVKSISHLARGFACDVMATSTLFVTLEQEELQAIKEEIEAVFAKAYDKIGF